MIYIANPLYDVVFKGLMQDLESAKLLISAILEMEVLELEFKPHEYLSEVDLFSIYRVDFKAKIKIEENSHLIVLIELQKIKFYNQNFRFRRYIGNQYANKDNMNGNVPIPIITIYLLGHHLQVHENIPIIRVKRQYLVHGTQEILKDKEPFIEGITHDAIVIQIPAIKKKKGKKTDLEKILSIFDVAMMRFIEFDEKDFPVSHYSLLKRLLKISQDTETRKLMDIEDDFLDELRIREESYEELQIRLIEEKKRTDEEKKRADEEKKRADEEKKRADEKNIMLMNEKQRIRNMIETLRNKEFSDKDIEEMLNININNYF